MSNKRHIAEIAANFHKKPSKADIFSAIEHLIEAADIENPRNNERLAKLYAFFMPPVTKIKGPFHWLVKARGNKDVRYYLNYVYSDGKRLISTDGHRAHVVYGNERPAGWYDDNEQLAHDPDWATYPNIDAVLPCKGSSFTLDIKKLPIHTVDLKTHLYVMSDGFGMNKKYIDEACGLSPEYKLIYFKKSQRCKVLYDNAEAVIMGRKIT